MTIAIIILAIAAFSLLGLNGSSSDYVVSDNEPSDTNADLDNSLDSAGDFLNIPLQQKIQAMMKAIAFAEGFYNADGSLDVGSVPVRANNPGDMKVGNFGLGVILKDGSIDEAGTEGITIFPNVEQGWARLQHQVTLMLTGKSKVYAMSFSFLDVAYKYAGGDYNWGLNVASRLDISPESTLQDFASV